MVENHPIHFYFRQGCYFRKDVISNWLGPVTPLALFVPLASITGIRVEQQHFLNDAVCNGEGEGTRARVTGRAWQSRPYEQGDGELPVVPEMEYGLRGCMKSSWCAGRARRTAGRNWKDNRTKLRMHGTILKLMIVEFASHFLDGDATLEVEFSKSMCGNIRLRAVPVETIWVDYNKAMREDCVWEQKASWIFWKSERVFWEFRIFQMMFIILGFHPQSTRKIFPTIFFLEKMFFRFLKSC